VPTGTLRLPPCPSPARKASRRSYAISTLPLETKVVRSRRLHKRFRTFDGGVSTFSCGVNTFGQDQRVRPAIGGLRNVRIPLRCLACGGPDQRDLERGSDEQADGPRRWRPRVPRQVWRILRAPPQGGWARAVGATAMAQEGTAGQVGATVAFVTISYGPDRDRCLLLRRSLDDFAPAVEHWIVVDRADLPLFQSLQNSAATVITTEEVLPLSMRRVHLRRVGLRSNMWIQARGKPVRGWLLQQLIKLAIAEELEADVLVYADSDVVLLRPFRTSFVIGEHGHVRLFARPDAVDETLPNHLLWHRSAETLLGIGRRTPPMADFITSLVPWKRENAVALLRHVERNTGRHWLRALAGASDVSEYTLYGRFACDVLGERAGQYLTSSSLCRDYWAHAPLSPRELDALLDGIETEEIGVSITAKAGMQPADYVGAVEERWAAFAK
jgi:uncharacterized protein DUF6492